VLARIVLWGFEGGVAIRVRSQGRGDSIVAIRWRNYLEDARVYVGLAWIQGRIALGLID